MNSLAFTALPSRTGKTPVAIGSSVPVCPAFSAPNRRFTRLTALCEVRPSSLFRIKIPVTASIFFCPSVSVVFLLFYHVRSPIARRAGEKAKTSEKSPERRRAVSRGRNLYNRGTKNQLHFVSEDSLMVRETDCSVPSRTTAIVTVSPTLAFSMMSTMWKMRVTS